MASPGTRAAGSPGFSTRTIGIMRALGTIARLPPHPPVFRALAFKAATLTIDDETWREHRARAHDEPISAPGRFGFIRWFNTTRWNRPRRSSEPLPISSRRWPARKRFAPSRTAAAGASASRKSTSWLAARATAAIPICLSARRPNPRRAIPAARKSSTSASTWMGETKCPSARSLPPRRNPPRARRGRETGFLQARRQVIPSQVLQRQRRAPGHGRQRSGFLHRDGQ